MLLKQMQYFVKVVELHSFTQAAEELFLSQSAISQQIKALEEELGVTLLQRGNRQFTLTPAGEYFYTHAKEELQRLDNLTEATKRLEDQSHAPLRIAYPRSYDGGALQQALLVFTKRFPQVQFHISTGNHEELYDMLRYEQVDFALNDQRRTFSNQYVNYQLAYCNCYAELPLTHPLSEKAQIELSELADIPCVIIASNNQREHEIDFYKSIFGISGEVFCASQISEARMLAVSKRGYLWLEGNSQAVSSSLKRIPLLQRGAMIKRNYCAFWKHDMTTVYIEELAELLRIEFRKENER